MQRNSHPRKGITLLFVVSILALFLLMGTAFVIVSNNYLRASHQRSVKDLFKVDGEALIEKAFYDLLRGPALSDSGSPLRGHSLLEDMYGYGFSARIRTASPNPSQQFITLTLDFAGSGRRIIDGASYTPDPVPSMAGLVLTVVTGPAQGLTTRIIDHQVTQSGSSDRHTLTVFPLCIDNAFNVDDATALVGERVVVNGRPFSGTGAGNYNPNVPKSQPALSDTALRPNQRNRSLDAFLGKTGSGNGYYSMGNSSSGYFPNSKGPNESYDAFDFQNMFLAGMNPDGSIHVPSFHRQDLVDHGPQPSRANFRAFTRGGPADDGVMVDNDNNGQVDGMWMDIGLPSMSSGDGIHFKPLVSYTVVDLDGRINVNAHGNLQHFDRAMNEMELLDLGAGYSPILHRGQGYGPPEISLAPLFGGDSADIIGVRYGEDGKPGEAGVRDGWSSYKLYGYPDANASASIPGTVDRHFGTTMDIHGRFAIGYPNDIRDISDPDFPIGLPVSNIATSMLTTEAVDSAYEMSFATGTFAGPDNRGFDTPFTARELEGVFRRNDRDYSMLAHRLWDVASGALISGDAIHSMTTDSFEVPTLYENLPYRLYRILNTTGDPEIGIPTGVSDREKKIRQNLVWLLPPEVMRGLPMNVNRSFGDGIDNNGNGVTDEMGEVNTITHPNGQRLELDEDNDAEAGGDTDAYLARAHFARHLYIMTLLTTERVDRTGDGRITLADWYDFNDDGTRDDEDWLAYRKMIAQWAVNVVDFRDRDSIMTPFEVDLNPWNGWDVDADVSTEESSLGDERVVLWGTERPELLISETFASHDRRTQDLDYDPSRKRVADGDDDLDSNLVPNVSAFFELYNPWVMNDANQVRPAEFYEDTRNGVDLQKTSLDGSSPVWRLVVTGHNEADLDPDDATNNDGATAATSVRRIYFIEPSFVVDSGPEVYYPDASIDVGFVPPGVYAVVGSAGIQQGDDYVTYFGRRFTPDPLAELDQTRRIVLDPKNKEIEIAWWDKDANGGAGEMAVEKRSVVNIPIGYHNGGWIRNLGVSDPLDGYTDQRDGGVAINLAEIPDGQKYVMDPGDPDNTEYAFDEPIDRKINRAHYDDYLANDGVRAAYRTVHLQRLANPLLTYNAQTNPYLTIDSSSLDLVVYNGVELATADPLNVPEDMRFGSFERRSSTDDNNDPAENGQHVDDGRYRLLFKHDRTGHEEFKEDPDADINGRDLHVFSRNLIESWGGLNQAYRDANPADQQPFASLTWNNRPFASQLELANVPFTSSYWLTRLFDAAVEGRDVYTPPLEEDLKTESRNYTAQFPYLLNFYSDQLEGGEHAASLHRLLEFLEVPSRFIGTDVYVNPRSFRGTTHGLTYGLAAPFDTISNYRYPGKLNLNTILDERVWNGLMQTYVFNGTDQGDDPGFYDAVKYSDWDRSRDGSGSYDFANPYRSARASNLVPEASMVVDPAECGLYRADQFGEPLFDFDPNKKRKYNNDDRAAYFKYDMRQRMGNLVTTRSSVFAIWITVGYFEVNADGSMRTRFDGTGYEIGADTGEVRRNRGFFIVDRSIPVALEPGQNHNVDRAVLVRSIIE